MFKPTSVNIFGNKYLIEYVDEQFKVDIHKQKPLYGQMDYPSQSMRIFDNGTTTGSGQILSAIMEEILHCIAEDLGLQCFEEDKGHQELRGLCTSIADVFIRNGWWKEEQECSCEVKPKIITIIPEMTSPIDDGVDIPIGKAV